MSQDYDPVPCMFSLWMNLLSSLGAYMRLAMFGMVCTQRALAKFKTFDTTYVRTLADCLLVFLGYTFAFAASCLKY